jgi:hypothetical protein
LLPIHLNLVSVAKLVRTLIQFWQLLKYKKRLYYFSLYATMAVLVKRLTDDQLQINSLALTVTSWSSWDVNMIWPRSSSKKQRPFLQTKALRDWPQNPDWCNITNTKKWLQPGGGVLQKLKKLFYLIVYFI